MSTFTLDDWYAILESLEYTRTAIREYTDYPSYDFKMQRLAEINELMGKCRRARDAAKKKEGAPK